MEFRLYYRGPLPAETSNPRGREKHLIRKQVHCQLKELWQQYRGLNYALRPGGDGLSEVDHFSSKYRRGNYSFASLARKDSEDYVALDILFLRRDAPGNLIRYGGDIDNRLKVVLDGLQIPDSLSGMEEHPEPHETPMFCLLQNDDQITSISVTTDRLLIPIKPNENVNDVLLIIHVTTRTHSVSETGTGWM